MTLELWLAYVLAATILLVIPGPTVLLVMSYAMARGRRSAWLTVPGVMAGDALAISLSLAGLGALLSASATLFAVLKWIGAGYLVLLGARAWRVPPALDATAERAAGRSGRHIAAHAFAVTALNPKGLAFFVAFLPQFMDAHAPLLPQGLVLAGTFVALGGLNALGYALALGTLRDALGRPSARRLLGRLSGAVLIGAGVMTAALRRAG